MAVAIVFDLVAAGVALVCTVAVGTAVHELSHATVLHVAGIPCRFSVFPSREERGPFRAGLSRPLATVTPVTISESVSPWTLRLAAMMPLVLLAPFALVAASTVPNPYEVGDPVWVAASIGWAACALPSPQDFSLLWYPEEAIASHAAETATASQTRS
ncbi:hypothetical protein VB773_16320 [Haloarculaceae archaeon H-GB2-1]|nr:hypothetical protein [Haloarculaceae archaeon H-GB1-1]MEA5387498.1 hypothetical protein [Haloarculaceae archaeon H-GB11]MEA5408980.1 hypothetical protein [Haloarculaceae archaeon H-GB2-1]